MTENYTFQRKRTREQVSPRGESNFHWMKLKLEIPSIHILNDNGSFTFYVDVFFPLSLPRVLSDLTVYMSKTTDVLKEAGTAYHLGAPRFITVFGGSSCCSSVLDLCIVFLLFFSLRPVSCVPNVASFSGPSFLDCPFGFYLTFIDSMETAKTQIIEGVG